MILAPEKSLKYRLLFEIVGILIAALLTYLVIFPFKFYELDFPLIYKNGLLVFVSALVVRWQFFIKHCFFSHSMLLHGILFFLSLYIGIYFISIFGEFKLFFEEVNLSTFMPDLSYRASVRMRDYMKSEYMFFSVLAIVSCVLFCIKLVRSVWRLMKIKKAGNNFK